MIISVRNEAAVLDRVTRLVLRRSRLGGLLIVVPVMLGLLLSLCARAQVAAQPGSRTGFHQLTPHSMALSPDGRWLAFGRSSSEAASGELEMSFAVFDSARRVTTQIGTFNYGSLNFGPRPVWSPNSELLAYYAVVDETLQLKVWDRKRGEHLKASVLVDKAGAAELQLPQWTPDSRYVLCLSNSAPPRRLWEEQGGDNYTARLRAELVGQRPAMAGVTVLGTPALDPALKSKFGADDTSVSAGPPHIASRQVVALDTKTGALQGLVQGAEFVQLQISDDGKVALAGALDAHGELQVYTLPLPVPSPAVGQKGSSPVAPATAIGPDGQPLRLVFRSTESEPFQNFNLSPSGRYAAYLVERSGEIELVDLLTGNKRNLTSNLSPLRPNAPNAELEKIAGRFDVPLYKGKFGVSNGDVPVWTRDGSSLLIRRVVAQASLTVPQRAELWQVPLTGEARRVTQDPEVSIFAWADCHDRSRVNCVVGPDGAVMAVIRVHAAGDQSPEDALAYARIEPSSGATRVLRQRSASSINEVMTARLTGDMVSVEESMLHPPELWWTPASQQVASAASRSLELLNPAPLPEIGLAQEVEWTSATGDRLFAVLRLPADARDDERLPVILDVYPGRQGLESSRRFELGRLEQLRTRARFAVLRPDLPVKFGSGHVCEDFARYATEALEAAIATGRIDGIRAGVMGLSYGGYAVNCIITHTDRFSAAVSEAGPSDLASSHALGGRGEWNVTKSWQWETPERIVAESPVYHLDKVKTPVLFATGKTDLNNALQEYEMYFGLLALRRPAALASYDRAGHGDYDRFPDFWQRVTLWFETYLRSR